MDLTKFAEQTVVFRNSQVVIKNKNVTLDPNKIYFNLKSVTVGQNIVNKLTDKEGNFIKGLDFTIPVDGEVAAVVSGMDTISKPIIMTERSGAEKIINLKKYLCGVYNIPEDQKFTISFEGEPVPVEQVYVQRSGYRVEVQLRRNVTLLSINVEYDNSEEVEEELIDNTQSIKEEADSMSVDPTLVEPVNSTNVTEDIIEVKVEEVEEEVESVSGLDW